MFGTVLVYSSSAIYAYEKFQDAQFFLKRHLVFLAAGFALMFYLMWIDLSRIQRAAKPLMIFSILLLFLLLIPGMAASIAGARRWFRLGSLSFQPSELAKFALIIYLASFISRKGYRIKDFFHGYLPALSVTALTCGLVLLQPDLGTAIAIFFVGFLIIFIAGARPGFILATIVAFIPALYFLIFSVPYRKKRMLIFMNPWQDTEGAGFQIIQSFLALGSGGLLGVGLGQSKQKLFYLPESHTDFIFSIIGEELGFLGSMSVLILFGVLVWQGMRGFLRERRLFNKMLIFGIISMIAFEALVNVGVSTGTFPTKGLPLPFISYGGSSLLFHMAAIGIMLNAMRDQEAA